MPAPVTSGPDQLAGLLSGIPLSGIVLGVDFDGTLAPIVPDPDLAQPEPDTVRLLQSLAAKLSQLVLISGRDTEVLENRVPVAGIRLIGNHGLEEKFRGHASLSPLASPYVAALERAADAVQQLREVTQPGVRVERKLAAISVHYRQSHEAGIGAQLYSVLKPLAAGEGLRLHPGRFVWELRPNVEINKGTVIRELAAELRPEAFIYMGDDWTDADAFSALSQLTGVRTVAVGVISAEVPPDAFRDCDLLVAGVDGVRLLLSDLLAIG